MNGARIQSGVLMLGGAAALLYLWTNGQLTALARTVTEAIRGTVPPPARNDGGPLVRGRRGRQPGGLDRTGDASWLH